MKALLNKLTTTGQTVIKRITGDTADLLQLQDESGNVRGRFDYLGRRRITSYAGAAPSVAAGAGAGTSPTVSVSGDDTAGKVTVTTGTSPAAGTLATLTFSATFANEVIPAITARDAATAALTPFGTGASATLAIKTAGAPAASTTYVFYYLVVGA